MSFIKQIFSLLSRRGKEAFALLLFLSFIVSIFESISMSAVMFFISTVTNFNLIEKTRYYAFLYSVLGCKSAFQFTIILGVTVIILYFIRAGLNVFHIFATSKISFGKGRNLALRAFDGFLNFKYSVLISKNSAELAQAIFSYSGAFSQVCLGFVGICSELLIILGLYVMLLWVNFKMTLYLTAFLSFLILIVIKLFSKKLAEFGKRNQKFSVDQGKVFTEVFCNFKLIKIHGNGDAFMGRFDSANLGIVNAGIFNNVLQSLPRFVLETIGFFILVAMILYVIFYYKDPAYVVPIVSIYALAFYRFLPSINKMLTSYNQIVFNRAAVGLLYDYLGIVTEKAGNEKIVFNKQIQFKDLTFYYKESHVILDRINLTIDKGSRIGLVGPSGSGKSTLAGLIMGVLRFNEGKILIDGKELSDANLQSWRLKIGYIPQQIYLFDGTVAGNVTFGREYNEQKLINALKKSNIYDFLLTQDGLKTKVGEGGAKLSGGQKQRIAIARALYGDPEILILDEATSSLDNKTEDLIMNEIYKVNEDKTLIIIAHRLTTIEKCDIVYRIANGQIQLVKSNKIEWVEKGPSTENLL